MWLERGRDNDVFSSGQLEPRANLPQIDEELGTSAGSMGEEKVSLQVDPRPAGHLSGRKSRENVVANGPKEASEIEQSRSRTSRGTCIGQKIGSKIVKSASGNLN